MAIDVFLAGGDVSVGGSELDLDFRNRDFEEPKVVDKINLHLFSLQLSLYVTIRLRSEVV